MTSSSHHTLSKLRLALPRIVSRLLIVAAVLIVLNVAVPHPSLFHPVVYWLGTAFSWVFFEVMSGNLGEAVFLVILAVALERRKRAAWIVLVVFLCLQFLVSVAIALSLVVDPRETPLDRWMIAQGIVGASCQTVWLILLVWARREFSAQSPRANVLRALATLLAGFAVTAAVGALLVTTVPTTVRRPRARLEWLWHRFVAPGSPMEGFPHWVGALIGLLQAISLLVAFWVLLRSQAQAAAQDARGEAVVRSLVAQSPQDSLAYFATRRDKAWAFAPDADAAIAYRVVLGTCLASGDPIGPPPAWPAAIRSWLAVAGQFGWTPAVVGASEAGARAYAEHAGLKVMKLGDEAVLEPAHFHLDAPEMKPVRQAVERMHRLGYRVRIRRHEAIGSDELRRLIALADRWRDTETERGFSMALGRLGDPLDGGCLMVEALFPPGERRDGTEVAGLLAFVPWGVDGWSLDVMRRNPEADNGVTELMVSELMASGVRQVSLNFAMFRSAFEEGARLGAGPLVRLWRRILLVASRWWQMESLYRSNVKYQPVWVPRFLCFEDAADVAAVGAATGVAEGFLDLPRWLAPPPLESPAPSPQEVAALMPVAEPPSRRLPEQLRVRQEKRAALLARGVDPYPPDFRPTHGCGEVPEASGEVAVAGRVLRLRDHGGVVFADLQDSTGRLQVLFSADQIADLAELTGLVDLGDHLGVRGHIGTSRTGTRSLLVSAWTLTNKALRPLPDKHRGLADAEARVRRRYLDLVVNPQARALLKARSAVFGAVRQTLLGRGFLEVETPILQTLHGGANARPFRTHINAYDLDLYLRIAPELYLKRLMVGDLDRVFEMGRNFRNEGADATHNPEFSMLEAYQAYADYAVMRDVIGDIILNAVQAATGGTVITGTDWQGQTRQVDLAEPWRVVTVNEALSEATGVPISADTSREELAQIAEHFGIAVDEDWNRGEVLLELYEHLCEARTVAPTFYCDSPAEVSPLTRPHRRDPRLAERWDLVCFGAEIGTAYSELVDPVLQRERLTEQSLLAFRGDPEAMELDEDFLQALEHGMPPAGGLGMGLDRLVMMITDTSIREALPFPLVRPTRRGTTR